MDYFSLEPLSGIGALAMRQSIKREEVSEEFTKIFYKELLRQAFSAPRMGEENLSTYSVNQDIFIDKLAEEMVRKNINLLK